MPQFKNCILRKKKKAKLSIPKNKSHTKSERSIKRKLRTLQNSKEDINKWKDRKT